MATMTATRISLDIGCSSRCADLAGPLFLQLVKGPYDECAVLELSGVDVWRDEHRTARKRADRAAARGYTFGPVKRERRVDEIHAINTSATHRQGRPMSESYRNPPDATPLPFYPCARHAVRMYGIENRGGVLVAYTVIYRAGELALVSQILGHGDRLDDEIMYLLMQGVVAEEATRGGFLVYNRFDSGTDGLRFFKTRLGFRPERVEWLP
jgi:hypothetical protein